MGSLIFVATIKFSDWNTNRLAGGGSAAKTFEQTLNTF